MKKVFGYVVSVFGIFVMAIGFGVIPVKLTFLEIAGNYVAGIGIVMIVVGIMMSLERKDVGKKAKRGEDEVPIYEGVGKKRRVVGYRKE
ncbi:hypothetical protein KAT36_03605 [Candidatus Pacearchaeota archaeon]|nr:hypothetical protein [Candidatus Pacearchaeota archaeon]